MTIEEEISAIETAYLAWVQAGMPTSYTISTPNGSRSVSRTDMMRMREHLDVLKSRQARETRGAFFVAQFRDQD